MIDSKEQEAQICGIDHLNYFTMRYSIGLLFMFIITINILQAQNTPRLILEPTQFNNKKGQTVEAEMGTLTVPENRTKNNQKTLKLKFVRFKSTNPNPGSPIVYLAGGPGGSGISAAKGSRFELFMSLRQVADVIAFDQRGTGLSDKPIRYNEFWSYPLDEALVQHRVDSIMTNFTQKAEQYWTKNNVDLSAYNSIESAHDLNDLRKALGTEKISLWSISYGSHLALATMKLHEGHLDKVILAGVEGPNHTVKLPSDSQKLLERIDSLLKADNTTNQVFPDFLGDLKKLLAKVAQNPILVSSKNPITKQPVNVMVGSLELQITIARLLGGPNLFSRLPYRVQSMLNGDFSELADWFIYTKGGYVSAMSMAMDVASGISRKRKERVQQEGATTILGNGINFGYNAKMTALAHLNLGEKFRQPTYSKLPVLCISGTLDGRTPVSNAEEVLQSLPNGKHLIIEGAGHSDPLFLSSPKIEEIIIAFLSGNPIVSTSIKLPPIEFYLGPDK